MDSWWPGLLIPSSECWKSSSKPAFRLHKAIVALFTIFQWSLYVSWASLHFTSQCVSPRLYSLIWKWLITPLTFIFSKQYHVDMGSYKRATELHTRNGMDSSSWKLNTIPAVHTCRYLLWGSWIVNIRVFVLDSCVGASVITSGTREHPSWTLYEDAFDHLLRINRLHSFIVVCGQIYFLRDFRWSPFYPWRTSRINIK